MYTRRNTHQELQTSGPASGKPFLTKCPVLCSLATETARTPYKVIAYVSEASNGVEMNIPFVSWMHLFRISEAARVNENCFISDQCSVEDTD
jgi:hypothetical protein